MELNGNAVTMSSANGLVGTGFESQYRLQPRASFKGPLGRCKATTSSSFSLTSNMVRTFCPGQTAHDKCVL